MTPKSLTFLEFRFEESLIRKLVHMVPERTPPLTIPQEAVGYVYYNVLGFQLPNGLIETLGQPANFSPVHFVDAKLVPVPGETPRILTRHGTVIPFEPCVLV